MMSLFYLAMNPNITAEQFVRLAEEQMQAKSRCYEQVAASLDDMSPENAVAYLQAVLPILMSW